LENMRSGGGPWSNSEKWHEKKSIGRGKSDKINTKKEKSAEMEGIGKKNVERLMGMGV